MEQNKTSAEIAKARALSSPVRVRILQLLKRRSYTLSEVSRELKISKTNAKVHLAKLLYAGLIIENLRSKWKYYSLAEKNVNAVHLSIPLVALFLSLASLYAAFQNTVNVISPDHEYNVLFSFTAAGWLYLATAFLLGFAFIASVLWIVLKRWQEK